MLFFKENMEKYILTVKDIQDVANGTKLFIFDKPAEFDFKAGQCKVIEEGSLQDASVRQEICRVMEGGEEAFEQRYRRIGKGGRHV